MRCGMPFCAGESPIRLMNEFLEFASDLPVARAVMPSARNQGPFVGRVDPVRQPYNFTSRASWSAMTFRAKRIPSALRRSPLDRYLPGVMLGHANISTIFASS